MAFADCDDSTLYGDDITDWAHRRRTALRHRNAIQNVLDEHKFVYGRV